MNTLFVILNDILECVYFLYHFRFPVKLGGFGVRSPIDVAPAAFASSFNSTHSLAVALLGESPPDINESEDIKKRMAEAPSSEEGIGVQSRQIARVRCPRIWRLD